MTACTRLPVAISHFLGLAGLAVTQSDLLGVIVTKAMAGAHGPAAFLALAIVLDFPKAERRPG